MKKSGICILLICALLATPWVSADARVLVVHTTVNAVKAPVTVTVHWK